MKDRTITMTMLSLLFSMSLIAGDLDGFWQVEKSHQTTEIQMTHYGLKAKLMDQNRWTYYDRVNARLFEDDRGNSYRVISDGHLVWKSRRGAREIRMFRKNRNYDSYGSGGYVNPYDDGYYSSPYGGNHHNNGYGQSDYGNYCPSDYFDNRRNVDQFIFGRWRQKHGPRELFIQRSGRNIKVKEGRYGRWVVYRHMNRNKPYFKDRYGNTLKFRRNGTLDWDREHRRDLEFRKS